MDLGLESGRLTKEVYVKNFLLNFQSQSSMVSLCKIIFYCVISSAGYILTRRLAEALNQCIREISKTLIVLLISHRFVLNFAIQTL